MRQIVLDTETTGLDPKDGHRIIEIGCVELVNRKLTGRHFHQYINPQRDIEQSAIEVHGITNQFVADKPIFSAIASDFFTFVRGAELIIHNAAFDIGFIDHELSLLPGQPYGNILKHCTVIDTLQLARAKHPGQKNNLDALCKRYGIDNSHRELHGALLDAEILADVYLFMTGGQTALSLAAEQGDDTEDASNQQVIRRLPSVREKLRIIHATAHELEAHSKRLEAINKSSGGKCIWENVS